MKLKLADFIARLTRGYVAATGKQPDNLAKIKIRLEAAEKLRQQDKVIDIRDRLPGLEGLLQTGLVRKGRNVQKTTPKPEVDPKLRTAEDMMEENKKAIKRFEEKMKEDRDFSIIDPEKKAGGGRMGLSYLLAEDGNERIPLAEGSKAPDEIEEREYEGPYYETDKAEEALKELARRYIEMKVAPAKVPISDSIQLMFDLNKMKIGGSKDFLGGEIDFGYNKNFGREGESYGIGYRKSFAAGGIDKLRRLFLKMLGAGAATTAAVKSGIIGFGKKGATKKVAKEIIKTPNAPGKPEWFDSLVTRVINEGDDVTKQFATKERELVNTKQISPTEEVTVYRDLDEGSVRINYVSKMRIDDTKPYEKGNIQRASNDPDQVDLIVREGEVIEPDVTTGPYTFPDGSNFVRTKSGGKTKSSFEASEAEPRSVGGPEDADIEFDGIREVNNVDDLMQDVSALEEFGTGKKLTGDKAAKAKKKKEDYQKFTEDQMEQAEYLENKYGPAEKYYGDPDDYASGGRVGLLSGGGVLRVILQNLAKKYGKKPSELLAIKL